MTTHFLKFENEIEAKQVFIQAGANLTDDEALPPYLVAGDQIITIDVVFGNGVLHVPTGETFLADGVEVPRMVPIEGYHVNVTGLTLELEPYLLPEPKFPKCVFA